MRLYTAQTPNGRKISIALEELGKGYDVEWVHLDEEEQLEASFLAMNPNHKIPVLEDDGQVIWESGAILLYLGENHDPEGRILPQDPKQRMEAIQYAFFQTGGIGPNLGRPASKHGSTEPTIAPRSPGGSRFPAEAVGMTSRPTSSSPPWPRCRAGSPCG
ncbi:MAG: glutathione S-transferase N-terminal domain-containing protein [Myxococcota bacterium]|nr:glutathione S-transferase N-terminal domain-containing protein [Myxococcota bacterium]